MDAVVYLAGDGRWWISLRVATVEVDEAGPFDDEVDAINAADRCVYGNGSVSVMTPVTMQAAA